MALERLRWCDEVSPAHWIVDCIHPFAQDVGSIVPQGFEGPVRILHPSRRELDGTVPVRPSEVAGTAERSSTVGGDESLIEELLAIPRLEAMRAEISHGVTWDSDHLNR